MNNFNVLAMSVAFLTLIPGCYESHNGSLNASSNPDTRESDFEYVASRVPRDLTPSVTQTELDEVSRSNADFAFDLYHELSESPGNMIFSPYSLTTAMAMLYAGARGTSEREIADVFHFTLPQDRLHITLNAVDLTLKTKGVPEKADEESWFQLKVANALWGPPESAWIPSYLDLIAQNYGAGLRNLDFTSNPDRAREIVNDWVSRNTENKITELIRRDELISDATVLVITNAVYFKGRWEMPFEERLTKQGDFHLLDGSSVSTAMMEFNVSSMVFDRATGDGWTALSLPYDLDGFQGLPWHEYNGMSMIVIVPDEDRFMEFENSFDRAKFDGIIGSFNQGPAHFYFPKFSFRFHTALKESLSRMGMESVFFGVDICGMLPSSGLFVRDVIHEAFIQVDEKGTEAAAASGIGVDLAGGELLELTIDRPFIFVIRDTETGAILFIGRVLNPLDV